MTDPARKSNEAPQQQQLPSTTDFDKVAESCFEYLNMEMVETIAATTKNPEAMHYKLEQIGFRVGQKLVERQTKDRPRFAEKLDIIKFVCKEIWNSVFHKNISNLRTNHKGVFVLLDEDFLWIRHLSSDSSTVTKAEADKYITFPSGLIKGALDGLGVPCIVKAEITTFPACTFTVRIG